jgi:hypothetical protein
MRTQLLPTEVTWLVASKDGCRELSFDNEETRVYEVLQVLINQSSLLKASQHPTHIRTGQSKGYEPQSRYDQCRRLNRNMNLQLLQLVIC